MPAVLGTYSHNDWDHDDWDNDKGKHEHNNNQAGKYNNWN